MVGNTPSMKIIKYSELIKDLNDNNKGQVKTLMLIFYQNYHEFDGVSN